MSWALVIGRESPPRLSARHQFNMSSSGDIDVENTASSSLAELTSLVVANFVANNAVAVNELPALIRSVHAAFSDLGAKASDEPVRPAVSIKRSVTPDYLVSLEDGRKFKSLKRHLTSLGMTPDEYRRKWSLPRDYPMVAENYSKVRSETAKRIGLGRQPGAASAPERKPIVRKAR